jgi:hypothetical protein
VKKILLACLFSCQFILLFTSTLEQWGFRKDVRRTKKIWEQKNYDAGQDDNIRPWLTDFVNAVGEDLAKELLQGVGQVEQMEGI